MPAEWEPHEATWLAWPHSTGTWPAALLEEVRNIYIRLLEVILSGEKVHLLVLNEAMQEEVRQRLKRAGIADHDLICHQADTADVWIRDYGPIFIKSSTGKKLWCKWQFNAWGSKYKEHLKDNQIFLPGNSLVLQPCLETDFVLEGGSIDSNGSGVCLTTEQCLLHPNRGPERTREKAECYLNDFLGFEEILWLNRGIEGDDTDGHVDDIARFVKSDVILAAYEKDILDANYECLKENWERLERYSRESSRRFRVEKLPMPGKVIMDGQRRPASYANFYICNKAVLLPVFGHSNDHSARDILKDHFPDREIVAIPSQALVYGLGTFHCMTQQEPA